VGAGGARLGELRSSGKLVSNFRASASSSAAIERYEVEGLIACSFASSSYGPEPGFGPAGTT